MGGKVVSPTHRPPFASKNIPGTHVCQKLSRPQGHSAAGRIGQLKKKSNYLIGTWTRDLPACSIVPQPTKLPCAPEICIYFTELKNVKESVLHFLTVAKRKDSRRCSIPASCSVPACSYVGGFISVSASLNIVLKLISTHTSYLSNSISRAVSKHHLLRLSLGTIVKTRSAMDVTLKCRLKNLYMTFSIPHIPVMEHAVLHCSVCLIFLVLWLRFVVVFHSLSRSQLLLSTFYLLSFRPRHSSSS
jgi:hypothetical protein